jgi:prepilin-type N-terminal cleavage/methylation domain-containing protein
MKIFKKNLNQSFGFTIIETMVAVFILAIALTAVLNLTAQSLFTARYARNEITANYLAQEAADYIRNQRDSTAFLNNAGSNGWIDFLGDFGYPSTSYPSTTCFTTDGCYFNVDSSIPSVSLCSISNPSFGVTKCPILKYNKNGGAKGFYYYGSSGTDMNPNSNFKRKVYMVKSTNNVNEVFIYITIEWMNGNLVRSKTLNFSLLNWLNS